MYFAAQSIFLGGNNAFLPSWTLKLPESWSESKTDFKGEVDGFKIEKQEGINEKNACSEG